MPYLGIISNNNNIYNNIGYYIAIYLKILIKKSKEHSVNAKTVNGSSAACPTAEPPFTILV
jgi:hypothetical protein